MGTPQEVTAFSSAESQKMPLHSFHSSFVKILPVPLVLLQQELPVLVLPSSSMLSVSLNVTNLCLLKTSSPTQHLFRPGCGKEAGERDLFSQVLASEVISLPSQIQSHLWSWGQECRPQQLHTESTCILDPTQALGLLFTQA